MNRYRHLSFPAYIIAITLVIVPFFDAAMTLWPWSPTSAQWRFGAIGLGSNALMLICTGLLVALATAMALAHNGVLKSLGLVCAAAAVVTGLLIALFALDALQTRANVNASALLSFNVATLTAVGKLLLGTLALAGIARAGLRSSKEQRHAATAVRQPLAAPLT